jgi:hypothetical protein
MRDGPDPTSRPDSIMLETGIRLGRHPATLSSITLSL